MDITGFGSIVSSFINAQSAHRVAEVNRLAQEEANEANAALMRELNEKNHQYALEQNEWNKNEWQREFDVQNEYNTPAAKLQRLISAGLNPNFYSLDGVASAAAPGMVQSSDLSNQSTYGLNPNQPYLQDPNYLGGALNSFSQGLNQMAQRALDNRKLDQEQQKIDQNAPLVQAQVDNYLASTTKTNEETENTKVLRNEIAERIVLLHNQAEQYSQLAKLAGFDVQKAEIDLDYYRQNVATDLELKLKDLGLKEQQTKNLGAEYWKILNETALTGKELDLKDILIQAAQRDPALKDADLELLKEKINNEEGRWWRDLISGSAGFFGGAALVKGSNALKNWFEKKLSPKSLADELNDLMDADIRDSRKAAIKVNFAKMGEEASKVLSKLQRGGKDAIVAFKSFVSKYGVKAGKSFLKFASKAAIPATTIEMLMSPQILGTGDVKRPANVEFNENGIAKVPDAIVNPVSWSE